jgi:hypothetical protein
MKDWVFEWLSEKTTWVGFFTAASAFGFADSITQAQEYALIAIAVNFFAIRDHAVIPKK